MTDNERDLHALIMAMGSALDRPYREAIAAQIEGKESATFWREYAIIFARGLTMARLIGMSEIIAKAKIIEPEPEPVTSDAFLGPFEPDTFAQSDEWEAMFAGDTDSFVIRPFVEAVRAFEGRIPMLAGQIKAITAAARHSAKAHIAYEQTAGLTHLANSSRAVKAVMSPAFWASGVDIQTTTNLKTLVAEVIRGRTGAGEGLSLPEFIDKAQVQGAGNLTRARLETVLRNNVSGAFHDGRVSILRSPDVQRALPLVKLIEPQDRRSRGNPAGLYPDRGKHFQMNGYINTLAKLEAQGIVPPNGHQCRGTIRAITRTEATRLGLLNDDGNIDLNALARYNGGRQLIIDNGEYPDPGWITAA